MHAEDAELEHLVIRADGDVGRDGDGSEFESTLLVAMHAACGFALGGDGQAEILAADSSDIVAAASSAVHDVVSIAGSYAGADRLEDICVRQLLVRAGRHPRMPPTPSCS